MRASSFKLRDQTVEISVSLWPPQHARIFNYIITPLISIFLPSLRRCLLFPFIYFFFAPFCVSFFGCLFFLLVRRFVISLCNHVRRERERDPGLLGQACRAGREIRRSCYTYAFFFLIIWVFLFLFFNVLFFLMFFLMGFVFLMLALVWICLLDCFLVVFFWIGLVGDVDGYVKDLILRCGFWFFYGLVCGLDRFPCDPPYFCWFVICWLDLCCNCFFIVAL